MSTGAVQFFTDASNKGSIQENRLHINLLILKAVVLALKEPEPLDCLFLWPLTTL